MIDKRNHQEVASFGPKAKPIAGLESEDASAIKEDIKETYKKVREQLDAKYKDDARFAAVTVSGFGYKGYADVVKLKAGGSVQVFTVIEETGRDPRLGTYNTQVKYLDNADKWLGESATEADAPKPLVIKASNAANIDELWIGEQIVGYIKAEELDKIDFPEPGYNTEDAKNKLIIEKLDGSFVKGFAPEDIEEAKEESKKEASETTDGDEEGKSAVSDDTEEAKKEASETTDGDEEGKSAVSDDTEEVLNEEQQKYLTITALMEILTPEFTNPAVEGIFDFLKSSKSPGDWTAFKQQPNIYGIYNLKNIDKEMTYKLVSIIDEITKLLGTKPEVIAFKSGIVSIVTSKAYALINTKKKQYSIKTLDLQSLQSQKLHTIIQRQLTTFRQVDTTMIATEAQFAQVAIESVQTGTPISSDAPEELMSAASNMRQLRFQFNPFQLGYGRDAMAIGPRARQNLIIELMNLFEEQTTDVEAQQFKADFLQRFEEQYPASWLEFCKVQRQPDCLVIVAIVASKHSVSLQSLKDIADALNCSVDFNARPDGCLMISFIQAFNKAEKKALSESDDNLRETV